MSYTVIGFDVGSKKIGIAAGQSITRSAQGIEVIRMHAGQPDWHAIKRVVDEWQPDCFIVGLPKTADGKPTPLIKLIHRFVDQLTERYQLQVTCVDETLTSAEADYRIRAGTADHPSRARKSTGKKRTDKRDCVAAELIVETWFNSTA